MNMSYCRFQNTAKDFDACNDALELMLDGEEALSADELKAAKQLAQQAIDMVIRLAEEAGLAIDLEELEERLEVVMDEANADADPKTQPTKGISDEHDYHPQDDPRSRGSQPDPD